MKNVLTALILLLWLTPAHAQKRKSTKKTATSKQPIKKGKGVKPPTAVSKNAHLLDSILNTTPILRQVKENRTGYRLQIIYTQITRDANNQPSFKDYTFNLDSNLYFYCASMVKLPISILALEKINELSGKGLTRATPMLTDSMRMCQTKMLKDTTSPNGFPNIEHHIRKMLLVSDNVSFSRILEFVTPDYAHQRMRQLGFPSARLGGRFDVACIGAGNNWMNQIRFIGTDGRLLFTQPGDSVRLHLDPPIANMKVGKNVYRKKKLVSTPKDFSHSNFMPLTTIHRILRNLVFMQNMPEASRYRITADDWKFLMTQMCRYPRESLYPKYDSTRYIDSYKKYLIYGATTKAITQDSIRIINIVGRAYGFVSDCAYVVNPSNGTEFMISAVLYTNKRNTFGTGNYEYDTVGLPFLRDLGVALYRLESQRTRKYRNDLSLFSQYAIEK